MAKRGRKASTSGLRSSAGNHASAPGQPRARRRWPQLGARYVLAALGVLLVAGIVLRVLALGQTPGLISTSDSIAYVTGGQGEPFSSTIAKFSWSTDPVNAWPAGYSVFLYLAHGLSPNLSFAMLIQHLLGIATALLLFLTVRRVAPAAWGLIPAAVVLLAGPQILLEHAALAEALFTFLIAATVYCTVRASDGGWPWEVLAGLAAVSTGLVRLAGLPLIAVVVVWLLAARMGDVRLRVRSAAVALLAAVALYGVYLAEMKRETGFGGPRPTQAGNYGTPTNGKSKESGVVRVVTDLGAFWSEGERHYPEQGYTYDGVIKLIGYPGNHFISNLSGYDTVASSDITELPTTLFDYERHTRLDGFPFALLALFGTVGLAFARGRRLAVGVFMLAVTVVVLVVPIVYVYYDARYVVPGYGVLAAVGAVGAASVYERVRARLRREGEGEARTPRAAPVKSRA